MVFFSFFILPITSIEPFNFIIIVLRIFFSVCTHKQFQYLYFLMQLFLNQIIEMLQEFIWYFIMIYFEIGMEQKNRQFKIITIN